MKKDNYTPKELYDIMLPPAFWKKIEEEYGTSEKMSETIEQFVKNPDASTYLATIEINDHREIMAEFSQALLKEMPVTKEKDIAEKIEQLQSKHMEKLINIVGQRLRGNLKNYFAAQIEKKIPSNIQKITASSAEATLKGNRITLFYFGASWCGPCKRISPIISKLVGKYSEQVMIGKIDIDEEAELAKKYKVKGVPTMIFFKEGIEQKRMVGFQAENIIANAIEQLL